MRGGKRMKNPTESSPGDAFDLGATPILVLQVEDNPGDAVLVAELLDESQPGGFATDVCGRLGDALQRLGDGARPVPDVVLLDLGLPDSMGLNTLHRTLGAVGDLPVVVLTGLDDEQQGRAAVADGAEDYLTKSQLSAPGLLARTLTYAIERRKRLRERQTALAETADTPPPSPRPTGALPPSAPLRARNSAQFEALASAYRGLLVASLTRQGDAEHPATSRQGDDLLALLIEAEVSPDDLIELHASAFAGLQLDSNTAAATGDVDSDSLRESAGLFLLTAMGRLAAAYQRRG